MKVLRAVFRVEWTSARRDGSLWVLVAVFAALVAYASVGGGRLVRDERAASEAAVAEDERRLARLRAEVARAAPGEPPRASDPRSPMDVGQELAPRAAHLPLGPLAVVAVGQRDVLPQTLMLTTRARLASAEQGDRSSPLRQSTGPFDLAFVFVFLLPLLVIALSFDLLSSERDRGTLSLVLSQPVTLTRFLFSKALQRAALLLSVVLVLGVAGPLLGGADLSAPGIGLRLALYLALLAAYSLFWLALSVAVNAWGRSSAGNALSLIGLWLAFLIVIPGLASVAVDAIHPSPSRVELVNLAREAAREAEAQTSALEGDHGKPKAADTGRRALANQAAFEEQVLPVLARFRDQRTRQQEMVDDLRFLSPALLLSEALTDVTGSSVGRYEDFSRQVDDFHGALKAFFFERAERGAELGVADYDAMPRFAYREPPDGSLVARVGTSLLALGLACGGLVLLARQRLRRAEA